MAIATVPGLSLGGAVARMAAADLGRYPAEPSFLLHWRDPGKVATGGVYGVIPAGEFQPSSVALWNRHNDFDLWRNIVREYAEELLGEPEYDGSRSQPIDYGQWPFFQRLQAARADGSITCSFLGLGLVASTLTASILIVVVIDDDLFTEVFGKAERFNEEGEIVAAGGGRPIEGIPFTKTVVHRMLESEEGTLSLPLSLYIVRGGLRQGRGRAAQSAVRGQTYGWEWRIDGTCGDRRGRPDRAGVGWASTLREREVSGWAATWWVSRRSTRRRSRSWAARARIWGSFRGSKASACRLVFA